MPRKKTTRKSAPTTPTKKVSKTAFVLGQPETMSVKEVVEAGAKQGIKLSTAYVYNIRATAKKKAGKPGRKLGRPPKAAATANPTAAAGEDWQFKKMVLDIGLKKAQNLLQDLMELGRLWKAVELLSREIETTRRRVNALEHILIPNLKDTIHYISARLEEMERSYQVQLMRVKEIVRSH